MPRRARRGRHVRINRGPRGAAGVIGAYDAVLYGLVAFVVAGTGYGVLIAVVVGDWPDGTPGSVREGCLLERGAEWCAQARALAWAVSECAESGGGAEYEECVGAEFAERGGDRGALPAALSPALLDRDAELWELAGEAPAERGPRGGPVIG